MATPEETAAAEKEAADAKAAAERAAADEEAVKKKADEEKLGEVGKAALDAERKARRDADKRAKDAETKLKTLEDEKLSEAEKLKREAEEGKAAGVSATEKLRKANLTLALADKGLTGAKAKAASRLLDGVEYDEDDEPTNLDVVITAAKAEYGEDMFKGVKPPAPKVNGGEGTEDETPPKLTAAELDMAKSFGMTPTEYEQFKSPQHQPEEPAKT